MRKMPREEVKNKVSFEIPFKDLLPTTWEAVIMCIIYEEMFFIFTKNNWISYSGTHLVSNYSGLYDVANINELVQGNQEACLL